MKEYVEHICAKHQRTGTIRETLNELRDKLAQEVGKCKPDVFNEKFGWLPGTPVDKSKIDTWGELLWLKGFLRGPAVVYLDCIACQPKQRRQPK